MPLQAPDALFAPDVGPEQQPYTCSYHTLRLPDGRLLVLDIVRSDDTRQRALRVFLSDERGGLRALNAAGPADTWAPFAADREALDRSRDGIGRGPRWVGGEVRRGDAPDLGIQRVAFDLDLHVEQSAPRSDTLGLAFLRLTVEDHLRVHHRGWIEIDGERLAVDAVGAISVHIGDALCNYAYIVTPPTPDPSPGLLLAAVAGDDFRHLGALLGQNTATYSHGWRGLPPLSLHVGAFTHPLTLAPGGHHLHLAPGPAVRHTLLGVPTLTARARARYHHAGVLGPVTDRELGEVILEGRGEPFHAVLAALAG